MLDRKASHQYAILYIATINVAIILSAFIGNLFVKLAKRVED